MPFNMKPSASGCKLYLALTVEHTCDEQDPGVWAEGTFLQGLAYFKLFQFIEIIHFLICAYTYAKGMCNTFRMLHT